MYCTAGSDACGTLNADERISEVMFNDIDNISGEGDGPAGCYSDFTSISTNVFPGQTYAITVRNASGYATDACAVWIDWNRDFSFGDESSGEQVTLTSADDNLTYTGAVTIPASALIGVTRMRVRVVYTTDTPLAPCGTSTFGEVEDYTVNVVAPTMGACCAAAGSCTSTGPGACSGVPGIGHLLHAQQPLRRRVLRRLRRMHRDHRRRMRRRPHLPGPRDLLGGGLLRRVLR